METSTYLLIYHNIYQQIRMYSTPDISFHFCIIKSNIQATVIQPALHLGRYRHPSTLWAACRSGLLDFDFGGVALMASQLPSILRILPPLGGWQNVFFYCENVHFKTAKNKNRTQWYYEQCFEQKCQRGSAFHGVFNGLNLQPCTMKGKH